MNPKRRAKRKARELAATTFTNDKKRVVPCQRSNVAHGAQILQFKPTEVIDDPARIALMDELGVRYRVLSDAIVEAPDGTAVATFEPEQNLEPLMLAGGRDAIVAFDASLAEQGNSQESEAQEPVMGDVDATPAEQEVGDEFVPAPNPDE